MPNKINPRKYELFGHRDFTFLTLQAGAKGETGPLLWLDGVTLKKPYWVVERSEGKSSIFLDPALIEWQKQEIKKRLENQADFVSNMIDGIWRCYEKIKPTLLVPKALPLSELATLIEGVTTTWNWFVGLWWAVELLEEKPECKRLVEELMSFRKNNEIFVPNAEEVIRLSIISIYPTLKKYVNVLMLDEVLSGKVPSVDTLEEREKHSLVLDDKVYVGADIQKIKSELGIVAELPEVAKYQGAANIIKGQIGYKGKYTGTVSIVLNKEQAAAFPEGHVLVASQTTPDFIMAIQKSGAMVTDEGGIISHAAITSRELKIPCIIGTKVATQVLKDGDMVEVDANAGIVKIIK